ncbi:leukocyte receptor cluster member 1-like [Argonauta hians]
MNILPHKSWHVRTKKNIERVRRDEEKAAEEEKEKQRRIALAEQEARTEVLRSKVRQKNLQDKEPENPEVAAVVEAPQLTHINFFSAIEQKEECSKRANKQHEAEEKQKKEEWEKKIGLLTYLGQSAVEAQSVPPWYLGRKRKLQEETCPENSKRQKRNELIDPLQEMEKYLKHKQHKKHKHDKKEKKKKKKKKKEEDKEKKKKRKGGSSEGSKPTLEQLRAERLRREGKEREKARMLMAKVNGEPVAQEEECDTVASDRDRKYSSQYNPSFARQNRARDRVL